MNNTLTKLFFTYKRRSRVELKISMGYDQSILNAWQDLCMANIEVMGSCPGNLPLSTKFNAQSKPWICYWKKVFGDLQTVQINWRSKFQLFFSKFVWPKKMTFAKIQGVRLLPPHMAGGMYLFTPRNCTLSTFSVTSLLSWWKSQQIIGVMGAYVFFIAQQLLKQQWSSKKNPIGLFPMSHTINPRSGRLITK